MEPRYTFVEVTSDHRAWARARLDFDAARRIPDLFGRPGIEAKTGQTDPVVRKNRKLQLHFVNPKLAQACADLIESNGPLSVNVEVIKPKSAFSQRLDRHIEKLRAASQKAAPKQSSEKRHSR